MTKSKGLKAKYYAGLQEVVWPLVTLDLKRIKEIETAAKTYIEEQTFVKRITRQMYSRELLYYLIGQQLITLSLDLLKKRRTEDDYYIRFYEFYNYIENKIKSVGLFHLVISAPELIVNEVLRDRYEYIFNEYHEMYSIEEE